MHVAHLKRKRTSNIKRTAKMEINECYRKSSTPVSLKQQSWLRVRVRVSLGVSARVKVRDIGSGIGSGLGLWLA